MPDSPDATSKSPRKPESHRNIRDSHRNILAAAQAALGNGAASTA